MEAAPTATPSTRAKRSASHPKRLYHGLVLACCAVIVGAAAIRYNSAYPSPLYHGDETGWTRTSIHMAKLLLDSNCSPLEWDFIKDRDWGNLNPPLLKFAFSGAVISLRPHFGGQLPPVPPIYIFREKYEENKAKGRVIDEVVRARLGRVSFIFGLACIGLVMLIMYQVGGAPAALLSGVFVSMNPLLQKSSAQVMTDTAYNFFILLALAAGLWAARAEAERQALRRFLLLALVGALGGGVKYAMLILLTPFMLGVLAVFRARGVLAARKSALLFVAWPLLFCALALATNPFFWPDFSQLSGAALSRDWRLLRHGDYEVDVKAPPAWLKRFPEEDQSPGAHRLSPAGLERLRTELWYLATERKLEGPAEHPRTVVPALYGLTRPLQLPLMYYRWYEFRKWRLVVAAEKYRILSTPNFMSNIRTLGRGTPAEPWLALAGLTVGLWVMSASRSHRMSVGLFISFAASVTLIIFATRISDDERYVLPILLLRAMLAAFAIGAIIQWITMARGALAPFVKTESR